MLDITPTTTVSTLQNCSHTLANAFTAYNLNGISYLRNELGCRIATIEGTQTFRQRVINMILKKKKKTKTKTDDQLLKQFNKEVSLRRALKDITSIASSDSSKVSK